MPELDSSQTAQMRRQLQEQASEIATLKVWPFQSLKPLLMCAISFEAAHPSSHGSMHSMSGTAWGCADVGEQEIV